MKIGFGASRGGIIESRFLSPKAALQNRQSKIVNPKSLFSPGLSCIAGLRQPVMLAANEQ
jgi:hypothetical protein